VSWNVHYLRNADGVIDPETVAREIERQRPDVVLLQEVSRGWPIGGTLDGVEWLSRRLGMLYVYAPAADRQFGNVIFSRLRITAAEARELPQGAGTMRRSFAAATVELPGGRTVRLYDVHLAHRDQDTPTRLAQVTALLKAWDGRSPAIIAGDFNAPAGSPVIGRLTGAGLTSAQDTTGNGGLLTSPTDRPRHRIDWIFGTPDMAFEDFVRPAARTSDHFPLAVTVHLG
jgi:endonuclease/exonuclease/phosphatase family metal-dependent hydrolase